MVREAAFLPYQTHGRVAQLARAFALHAKGPGFESRPAHLKQRTQSGKPVLFTKPSATGPPSSPHS